MSALLSIPSIPQSGLVGAVFDHGHVSTPQVCRISKYFKKMFQVSNAQDTCRLMIMYTRNIL